MPHQELLQSQNEAMGHLLAACCAEACGPWRD